MRVPLPLFSMRFCAARTARGRGEISRPDRLSGLPPFAAVLPDWQGRCPAFSGRWCGPRRRRDPAPSAGRWSGGRPGQRNPPSARGLAAGAGLGGGGGSSAAITRRCPLMMRHVFSPSGVTTMSSKKPSCSTFRRMWPRLSYHDTIKLTKRSSPLSRKNGLKGEAHFVKIRRRRLEPH